MLNTKNNPTFIQHKLVNSNKFNYGFFGRHGGFSTGVYESMNTSQFSMDDPGNVQKNLNLAAQEFRGLDLYCVHQKHTSDVFILGEHEKSHEVIADAIVTNQINKVIYVNTADCTPIIFIDPKNKVIGATHAGWRGQVSGVVQNTIQALLQLGAEKNNVIAIIGPCIRRQSYVVCSDFFDTLTESNPDTEDFFHETDEGLKFDLAANVCHILLSNGIKNIYDCCIDTFTDDNFHSCRRAKARGFDKFGSNMSGVVLYE